MFNMNLMLASVILPIVLTGVIALAVGVVGGIFVYTKTSAQKLGKNKQTAAKMIENALSEIKTMKKEAILEAKEEVQKIKQEAEIEIKERRNEAQRLDDRLAQKEDFLNKKEQSLDAKIENVENTKALLASKNDEIEIIKQNLNKQIKEELIKLETISKMTTEEAKNHLISIMEEEARRDASKLVREIEQQAKDEGSKKAKDIITLAIQRCAADHTSEVTVSAVNLPSEDMKGRIIGREGRNIRALENATGMDLIIDDTPEAVVISGFDPVRREIAKQSLEKLIMDGRIHPARIEEVVEKVTRDMEQTIKEAGEDAAFQTEILGLHPEIIKTLGRLKYRTSYGQNVLKHSIEVSLLAGLMATELGADVKVAKRGGLLHDLGKALDHDTEGTHVSIGVQLARKCKESEAVIHCIEAHHFDVEFKSIEAILVQAADAISSSRPGARRENLETYIKRLEQLEGIADGFKGVEKSFAIQAGREIRIIVKPEEISDEQSLFLAKDIAKKIEEQMEYPGQIKVNVIRESRSVEYAK